MRGQQSVEAQAPAPSRSVRARVRRFIRDHDLLQKGEPVLAGVSGGPDSTCLLLTLAALRRSLGFELHAAYFDHGLRGRRAAAREERYVSALAESLAVPFRHGAGDVRGHARAHHLSLEEAARELRYRFLEEAAHDAGCRAVAVGHTQDDQAETVLLHLVRGSGLRGLAAMGASASWPVAALSDGSEAPRLVRPLLSLSREETERSCRGAGLEPLDDPSNRSRAHLRNRIRQELLPLLRRYNPRISEALVRLADTAGADVALLEGLASVALVPSQAGAGAQGLDRRALAALPPALQRHAVRLATTRALGDSRGLSERHVRAIIGANAGPTGARLDLPRGLRADVQRKTIVLSTAPAAAPRALPAGRLALPVPGSAQFGPWRFQAELLAQRPRDLASSGERCAALLDADACGPLSLRRRRAGDRFHPLGLDEPKKLQDFFVDAHVPRAERDAVPLVCGEGGIAWVVGQRPAEWAKVTAATRRIVRLRAAHAAS